MKNRLKILFLLFLALSLKCFAQQKTADRLKRVLKNAKTDSARYVTTFALGFYYLEINRDTAMFYYDRCISMAGKDNYPLDKAAAMSFKSFELTHLGKLPQALLYIQRALKLAGDPVNESKIWNRYNILSPHKARLTTLAITYHNRGHLMGKAGNTEQQINDYKNAIKLAVESDAGQLQAAVNMNLADVYQRINRLDSALIFAKRAELMAKQSNYQEFLGAIYDVTGEVYLKKGNNASALKYFHLGVAINKKQDFLGLLHYDYSDLADYYLNLKQPDSSLYYAKKELEVLHTMGSSENLGDTYERIYKSYRLQGQTDSAYKYQGMALVVKDSSYNAITKSLADFQKLSLKDQLRLQDLENEKELTQTRIRTYVLLTTIAVFMLLAIIFYRNNRQKQKANQLLHEQKEEILTQRDNLGQALEELKTTQTQLVQKEKMASLGELTAGIAHEIQNPLNFVNNFSEVSVELLEELKEEAKSGNNDDVIAIADDLTQNLQKINHHGKRADFIVKGMLEHSRTSTGERRPTDINILADEFLKLSYHGFRAKDKNFNAEMTTHFDPDLPKVNVAAQDIGRVLLNLFNNAFYAVNQKQKTASENYKPEVSLTTANANGQVIIKVKDNGIGIPEAIKDKIMQPFFTTKPTGEGTGLGLSLSYDVVVKGHGGALNVETEAGEFTAFTVTIPLKEV